MTSDERVCSWDDQSGQGHVLSSRVDRPLWVASGVGAREALHFDARGTYLATDGVLGLSATSPRTFLAVVQLVSTAGRFHAVAQGASGSSGTYLQLDANTWRTSGNREGVYVTNGNSYDSGTATSTAPRVHAFALGTLTPGAAIAGAVAYRINGADQRLTLTQGSGTFGSFSTANYTLVGDVDAVSTVTAVGDALVAEVLVYARALSGQELMAAERALMARYRIQ
jgi:hypothetical protein